MAMRVTMAQPNNPNGVRHLLQLAVAALRTSVLCEAATGV
jgi:hypothetical protein